MQIKLFVALALILVSVFVVAYISNANGTTAPVTPAHDETVVRVTNRPPGVRDSQRFYTRRGVPTLKNGGYLATRLPTERRPGETAAQYANRQSVHGFFAQWRTMYNVANPDVERTLNALSDARANYRARRDQVRSIEPEDMADRREAVEGHDQKEELVRALQEFLTDEQIEGLDNEVGWDLLLMVDPS